MNKKMDTHWVAVIAISIVVFLMLSPIEHFFNETLPYLRMSKEERTITDYVRNNYTVHFKFYNATYYRDFTEHDAVALILKEMSLQPEYQQTVAHNEKNWEIIDDYKKRINENGASKIGEIYKVRGIVNGSWVDILAAIYEDGKVYIEGI